MSGTLYFLQEGDAGAIKIGWTSTSITSRVAALQVGNSQHLNVLGVIPFQERNDERCWHERFGYARKLSEWFFPVSALLLAIECSTVPVDAISHGTGITEPQEGDAEQRIQDIFNKFGGLTKLADHLDLSKPTVCSWKIRQSIPQKHWRKILSLAEELNCDVTTECLVNAGRASA